MAGIFTRLRAVAEQSTLLARCQVPVELGLCVEAAFDSGVQAAFDSSVDLDGVAGKGKDGGDDEGSDHCA